LRVILNGLEERKGGKGERDEEGNRDEGKKEGKGGRKEGRKEGREGREQSKYLLGLLLRRQQTPHAFLIFRQFFLLNFQIFQ
jgi:hypothetical protein